MDKFRAAYIACATRHDFSALLEICETVNFCTTGYEKEEALKPTLSASLDRFDPAQDIIVPVGNVVTNLILGEILAGIAPGGFRIAIFSEKKYHIMEIGGYSD